MMCILRAGVAKLVYAPDSKSGVRQGHVGSSPTSGTILQSNNLQFSPHITRCKHKTCHLLAYSAGSSRGHILTDLGHSDVPENVPIEL
jgi:hypothetical protein